MQTGLRRVIGAMVLMASLFVPQAKAMELPPPASVAIDPFALYGEAIRFQVMRNGEPVGKHTVRFAREGKDLVVTSHLNLEIKVLFLTAYRYSYKSVGRWRDGKLHAMISHVDDDGEKSEIVVTRVDGQLKVTGPKGAFFTSLETMPTTHWNPRQVSQTQLINTLTGDIDTVAIIDRGATEVDGGRGRIPARRFEYTGDLRVQTWYDPNGHWVGMVFKAKDGSDIEYFCVDCRGATGTAG